MGKSSINNILKTDIMEGFKEILIKIAIFLHCGVDKIYHYVALIGIMIINLVAISLLSPIWLAAFIGLEIAVTKEYADSKNPVNTFSWWDIFAGVLGILTVAFVYILIF